jgi:hypothetical protein
MLNLLKKIGTLGKGSPRNFSREEQSILTNAGLYEQLARPNVSESYIADALRLAQSMETILDGTRCGYIPRKSTHRQTKMLLEDFKDTHPSYF